MYIAQGYQLGKNQPNKAFDHAQTLAFDEIERAFLGAQTADKPLENKPGSFERLTRGFQQLNQRGKTL